MTDLTPFHREVASRFGVLPNFFVSAPNAPEVIEKLWDFAKAAYLDNPMPSLFKERLFIYLSRYCPVRYCIIRHCGFLLGQGHASGDPSAAPQSVREAIYLLERPSPWKRKLDSVYDGLATVNSPVDWPEPGTPLEDWMFTAAAVIFVEPEQADRPLALMREALGGRRLEYFLALLAFIRTAHYWTATHPGLEIEDDVRVLLETERKLATLLLQDPDAGR